MRHNSKSHAWERLLELAEHEVAHVLEGVPAHLREAAEAVTLVYEKRPGAALIRDGIEPDTLGLFVGDAFADAGQSSYPIPPEIMLFLDNLWEQAEKDDEVFREEVRATYLHELGHYLGLNEDDLTERGLE